MRSSEEEETRYEFPEGLFPRRASWWVFQFLVLLSGFATVFTLTNYGNINLVGDEGSVDPVYFKSPNRRRLSQQMGDFFKGDNFGLNGLKQQTKEFFAPNPDLFGSTFALAGSKIPDAYYPYNLSGSFAGSGWINYTDNDQPYSTHVTTALRIRTFSVSADDDRYHVAQMRFMLTPTGTVDWTPNDQTQSTSLYPTRPSPQLDQTTGLMLQATGIYDTLLGHMQATTNDPLHSPDLPFLNITYPDREWPVSSNGKFVASSCQFLIDVYPDSITEDDFKKEQGGRHKDGSSSHVRGAYSAILDREYIDVHMIATIENLNKSCHNMTQATMEVDLLRYDIFILKAMKYALVATCLSFFQLLLLFKQMQYSTPTSNASKLSLTSVAMHSIFDAYVCLIHLTAGLYIDDLFNSFIMVSFVQFMIFSMFDLRLVLLVWRARRPLDFSSGWERMRSTLTKIYTGFYGGIILILLFLYSVRHQMKHFVFLLFAFWVPQIIRNVKTGERFALRQRFYYGVTAIRLFFPLYAFGCPRNFFEFPTNFLVVLGLLVFTGLQVFILIGQSKWGARFFIPKRLQPDYYEYHRTFQIDPQDDEKCAICMADFLSQPEDVEVVTTSEDKGKRDLVEKDLSKKVLTTPCNHHFCRGCLTRWMETKMICPTCRQPLPPYHL